jgi:hypothetical protein
MRAATAGPNTLCACPLVCGALFFVSQHKHGHRESLSLLHSINRSEFAPPVNIPVRIAVGDARGHGCQRPNFKAQGYEMHVIGIVLEDEGMFLF